MWTHWIHYKSGNLSPDKFGIVSC